MTGDRVIHKFIAAIKEDMRNHAEDAMNMNVDDLAKFNQITGAYRGMQHCLATLEGLLKQPDEDN